MEGIGLEYGLWTLLKASYSGRMYEQSGAAGSERVRRSIGAPACRRRTIGIGNNIWPQAELGCRQHFTSHLLTGFLISGTIN